MAATEGEDLRVSGWWPWSEEGDQLEGALGVEGGMLGEPAGTEEGREGGLESAPPAAVSTSQNLLLLRKVPAPTAPPLVSGMEDAEPGWLPLLSPLLPEPLVGED